MQLYSYLLPKYSHDMVLNNFSDIQFLPESNKYQPVLFYNEYWNLNSEYMPINSSTP